MAVATPRGLVVPVIRNVEAMAYVDIEKALADLAKRAKADAITVKDMEGGTFTISNGGVFGSLIGTPIINPPQSAILGMHGIVDRPIAVKGEVRFFRTHLPFSVHFSLFLPRSSRSRYDL